MTTPNFTLINPQYTTPINANQILDNCISSCKNKTFLVLALIFFLTILEIIIYKINLNPNTKERILEHIITTRNIIIIVLFTYELFFFVLY